MSKYGYFAITLFTALLMLSGCKSSPNLQPELTGTWTRTVKSGGGERDGILTFTPQATYELAFGGGGRGHEVTYGRYSQTGHTITFEGHACVDAGTYTFLVESGALKLTPVSDDCPGRKEVFGGKWTALKKPAGGE